MNRIVVPTIAMLVALVPVSVGAAPIFADNFDTENGGVPALNYNSFANFAVTDGTVDLIGCCPAHFDLLPGNGLYVDLDGSTFDAGIQTANAIALGPGSYVLSFSLAGSQRGTDELVNVKVFGGLSASYVSAAITRLADDPFSTVSLFFTLAAADLIHFSFDNGGVDRIGAILDNIELKAVAPEPATLLLMGIGLAVAARRLARQKS